MLLRASENLGFVFSPTILVWGAWSTYLERMISFVIKFINKNSEKLKNFSDPNIINVLGRIGSKVIDKTILSVYTGLFLENNNHLINNNYEGVI